MRQQVLTAIADPNVALLLLLIGALGIYAEFCAPGRILPGTVGATLFLMGASAFAALPVSGSGAALILTGFVLLALEARFATRGILTAAAAMALLLGALHWIDSADPTRQIRLGTAIAATIPFALVTSFLISVAMRARRNKTANMGDITHERSRRRTRTGTR